MKKIIGLACLLVFVIASWSFADITIKAETDKNKLSTDETLTYTLTVTSSEKNVPSPILPKIEGFSVVSRAQSSTLLFSKGQVSTKMVFVYVLKPLAPGKYTLAPAKVLLDKQEISTEKVDIEVTPGKKPITPSKPPLEDKTPQVTL